jgi:hypothetical protein
MSQDPELISAHTGITFSRIGGDPQQNNAYSYVANRPTIATDPTGRYLRPNAALGVSSTITSIRGGDTSRSGIGGESGGQGDEGGDGGTQYADLTVGLYEGEGANIKDHVGIGVNSDDTTGLYPVEEASGVDIVQGKDVPGVVKPDKGTLIDSIKIKTTPEEDAAAQRVIDERTANPGSYNLYKDNCTSHVRKALDAAGIETQGTIKPHRLFDSLREAQPASP